MHDAEQRVSRARTQGAPILNGVVDNRAHDGKPPIRQMNGNVKTARKAEIIQVFDRAALLFCQVFILLDFRPFHRFGSRKAGVVIGVDRHKVGPAYFPFFRKTSRVRF